MRVSAKKPVFDDFDWESIGIDNESTLADIKTILDKPAQINSYMLELYQLGIQQKQIALMFGCSASTVSLRLQGKVGSSEGIAKKPKDQMQQYIRIQEAKIVCPHSEHLEDTLLRFRVSPRRTQDIMLLYTETYPEYDNQRTFYELLRANRISEKKAKLIMRRFFLDNIIPEILDTTLS